MYCRRASTATSTPGSSTLASEIELGRGSVDVLGDADEVEGGAWVAVDRRVDLGRVLVEQRRQARHDLVALGVRQVGGSDLDGECRDVRDEQPAVSVVDQPARGRDRLEDRALLVEMAAYWVPFVICR